MSSMGEACAYIDVIAAFAVDMPSACHTWVKHVLTMM